jgi:DNA-binding transcriptional LysR family regulator
MDIRSLRYFIAVFEERSLSAAAKRCFVAQPSISATLAQLESDLATQLFVRHSKGVTPTDSGAKLYPHACRMVSDMNAMRSLFADTHAPLEVSISLSPFLSGALVSQVLKTLLDEIPGLTFNLVDASEKADLRFTCDNYINENDVFYYLWEDNYVIAMANDHWLSEFPSLSIKQIDKLAFISRKPCDIQESWNYLMQKQGITMDVRAQVKTEEYALDLVAAGLGVSLIPEHSLRGRSDVTIRPITDVLLKRVVGIAHTKESNLPAHLINTILSVKQRMNTKTSAIKANA